MEIQREDLARLLGLREDLITDELLTRIGNDDLFLHHLQMCKNDPKLLAILLREATGPTQESPQTAGDLVGRAAVALGRWASTGFKRVDAKAYQERISACESCPHLTAPQGSLGLYRLVGAAAREKAICGLCGCAVRRKAWLASEDCPDHRWPEELYA